MGISYIEEKFSQINQNYSSFYRELLSKGKLNCRDTGIGFWGCSSADAVFEFFKGIGLQRYKRFLDIGSGDGVVTMIASLFTDATGVEFDKELHKKSVEFMDNLGLCATLLNKDFMKMDLSGYDIIFINPDKNFTKVEAKLMKELKGTLIVYNTIFTPNYLERKMTCLHDQIPFTLYTTPE